MAFCARRWVGHETPTLFYLAVFGSFISYIYSAPPLKLKQSGLGRQLRARLLLHLAPLVGRPGEVIIGYNSAHRVLPVHTALPAGRPERLRQPAPAQHIPCRDARAPAMLGQDSVLVVQERMKIARLHMTLMLAQRRGRTGRQVL